MRGKNIPNAKLWGFHETWVDSGQRPFELSDKPQDDTCTSPELKPNPFEQ